MRDRLYTNSGKTYAFLEGWINEDRALLTVYYDGREAKAREEIHKLELYEWAKHCHGNAPGGTPYGYFRATRTGQRLILTV